MKLRFTLQAVRDITSIADYIRADNPRAAQRVRDTILETLALAASFPGMGRRQSVEGVRKLVTRRYPYVIYYSVDEAAGQVVVLAVQHTARESSFES
ncbi:MAG: type II toxin-antitoxin system RelE/ParE family toxin [Alphaproteobacteria bacterium]